jgi:hypothetical protein
VIDKKHAGNEIGRLVGLDYFPTNRAAIEELVTVLSLSETDIIATAVINAWLEESRERPTPADLRRLVASHNEARRERISRQLHIVPVRHRCPRCQDCGFFGGYLPPHPYAGPWKWCDCIIAREKQHSEPGVVEDANAAREKLIGRFAGRVYRGTCRNRPPDDMTPLAEIYHGDF